MIQVFTNACCIFVSRLTFVRRGRDFHDYSDVDQCNYISVMLIFSRTCSQFDVQQDMLSMQEYLC